MFWSSFDCPSSADTCRRSRMWRQLKVKNLNIEGPMGNLSCDLLCNWTKLKVELGTHKIDFDVCKTCDQNTASNYLWYHCKLRIPIFHQSSFLPQTHAIKGPCFSLVLAVVHQPQKPTVIVFHVSLNTDGQLQERNPCKQMTEEVIFTTIVFVCLFVF